MHNKLDEIMARKRADLAGRIRPVREEELVLLRGKETFRFSHAVSSSDTLAVIAEIKRRSPSAGTINQSLDSVEQARRYVNGAADCLSILTDEPYFAGSMKDLWDVVDFIREHNRTVPCLRKDFMVDPIQVLEAAEAGASAILIIVRALSVEEMKRLREAADLAGLDSIYEIHEERELETALGLDPVLLGVNNRDLTRFVTDLSISERLIPLIPEDVLTISESGIFSGEDAARARECGADAILVGEALVRAEDPGELIDEFKSG